MKFYQSKGLHSSFNFVLSLQKYVTKDWYIEFTALSYHAFSKLIFKVHTKDYKFDSKLVT